MLWKLARVVPLHKSGPADLPENYRPISILPVLSKILEKAVHIQLINFIEENKLLSKAQFGYRYKRSTDLAATLLTDKIRREVDQGKLVGVVFIDLSRAFNTISHSSLLIKLASYGIKGEQLEWFASFMFARKQVVDINGKLSSEEPIFTGVPQGSILDPLLFMLFFNDFVGCLKNAQVIKYADDTAIYVPGTDILIESRLNEDLSSISEYCIENKLINFSPLFWV